MHALLIALALFPAALSAQTVFFHFTNGTTQSYAVEDIRKLTFDPVKLEFVNDEAANRLVHQPMRAPWRLI